MKSNRDAAKAAQTRQYCLSLMTCDTNFDDVMLELSATSVYAFIIRPGSAHAGDPTL